LLPQITHHLTVQSYVARTVANGCVYGGYSVQTTRDHDGNLLTIVQDGAVMPTAIVPTPTQPSTQNQRETYLPRLRR
jgi:hypothetical protein